MKDDVEEYILEYVHHTVNAVKLSDGDNDGEWFPFSQIDLDSDDFEDIEVGEQVQVLIPEWLATDKGLT